MPVKIARARVTPVRQRTQFTCMAASMAMSLQALGVADCDEETVNRVMGCQPMKGASWEDALACAQYYGIRGTLVVPATLDMIRKATDAGNPVMVAWNPEGRDWSHASLVFDVDDENVHVADPNIPDPSETVRVVSHKDFFSKWAEKWPRYIVRRPALILEREITDDGRQVQAHKEPTMTPSDYARLLNRSAKFEEGKSLSPEEVSKVVGPEFAQNANNPPPEVEKLKEEMKNKNAAFYAKLARNLVAADRTVLFALRDYAKRNASQVARRIIAEIEAQNPKARTASGAATPKGRALALEAVKRGNRTAADFLADAETPPETDDEKVSKEASSVADAIQALRILVSGLDMGLPPEDVRDEALALAEILRKLARASDEGTLAFCENLRKRFQLEFKARS